MSSDAQQTARDVIHGQVLGALGTLHSGEPAVSMTPYAVLPDGSALIVHVSRLATHTADMLAHPRVSLLVIARDAGEAPPQATPRVTIAGDAVPLSSSDEQHAREIYLARFPDSALMFELPDFSLFAIRPRSVRVIGGFGRAATLTPEQFADALRE